MVFSIPANNGQQIQSVNNQGQDQHLLTRSGFNSWPAFSPDGKRIAFGSSLAGNYDIHVMEADGNNSRRLTQRPGLDMRPAWSPDGRRLAFTSNRDGHYQVYVMHADGSGIRRITRHLEATTTPSGIPTANDWRSFPNAPASSISTWSTCRSKIHPCSRQYARPGSFILKRV